MHIALVSLTITRDAFTRLPVNVPAHEVEVVKTVFGEDNVQVHDGEPGAVELDPAMEGERLVGKYGDAAVTKVFGENYKGAVSRACSSHEVTARPKTAKALAPA